MNKRLSMADAPLQIEDDKAENDFVATGARILSSFDASDDTVTWEVKIYKLDPSKGGNAAEEWLFSVQPDETDSVMQRVRDTEGTGSYRMRAYVSQGKTKRVFTACDFRVRAPSKMPTPFERPSEMAAVLAAMKEQQQQTITVLREMVQQRAVIPASVAVQDPIDTMTKMATAMGALMQALKPPEAQSATNILLEGVKLAQTLEGNDKETNMFDVVKSALENIGALAKVSNVVFPANGTKRLPAPSKKLIPPAAQPIVGPANQPTQQMALSAEVINEIKNTLNYLIGRAKNNSPADFYASWLTENWHSSMITWALQQPNLLEIMQGIDPRIAEHNEWFTRLIASLRQMVNNGTGGAGSAPDDQDDPDEGDDVSGTDTADEDFEDAGRSAGRQSDLGNNVWPDKGR